MPRRYVPASPRVSISQLSQLLPAAESQSRNAEAQQATPFRLARFNLHVSSCYYKLEKQFEGTRMLVTTKGRYAMRLMVYIAHNPDRKVALREVSESEDISLKYLEQLARDLVATGLLKSVRGHGGGYLLARPANEIRAGDVLRATEGTTLPVACAALESGAGCPRENECSTIAFWAGLDDVIESYVDNVYLADLSL